MSEIPEVLRWKEYFKPWHEKELKQGLYDILLRPIYIYRNFKERKKMKIEMIRAGISEYYKPMTIFDLEKRGAKVEKIFLKNLKKENLESKI